MMASRQNSRSGFTLIELMVVLGILFMILALTLPAVQSAREASRRATCANHLKQMILATHEFETSNAGFPSSSRAQWFSNRTTNQMSLHCELLPYLEQSSLYQSINFNLPCGSESDLMAYHATLASVRLEVFTCPSDSPGISRPYGSNHYRANVGLGEFAITPSTGEFSNVHQFDQSGAFVFTLPVLPLATFSDGLSNTVAFSEKLVGTGQPSAYDSSRDWISTLGVTAETPDEWVNACSNLSSKELKYAQCNAGSTWVLSGGIYTEMFMSVAPNSVVPDCGNPIFLGVGVFGARSRHPGGVNTAFADGSTRWTSSGIDLQVWRSLGTRGRGD
jgi:prepilin-type N-terminal cleavage/methylation domain-containing protein/prepilin-type processing-associated H-X9-DG protein